MPSPKRILPNERRLQTGRCFSVVATLAMAAEAVNRPRSMETSVAQSTERPSLTEDSDELARDYDRVSVDRQFQSGKMLVQELAPTPGERVLDVGCRTGLPSQ